MFAGVATGQLSGSTPLAFRATHGICAKWMRKLWLIHPPPNTLSHQLVRPYQLLIAAKMHQNLQI